jgi:hypothetical protein
MSNPTHVTVCDGKYTVIYDFDTGQSECLRYGEPWRDLCGDKMVLALFDEIVELREKVEQLERAIKGTEKYAINDPEEYKP